MPRIHPSLSSLYHGRCIRVLPRTAPPTRINAHKFSTNVIRKQGDAEEKIDSTKADPLSTQENGAKGLMKDGSNLWELLLPGSSRPHRAGAPLVEAAPSDQTPVWRGLSSTTTARASSETSPPDGIDLENPIFRVPHAFGVLPADGHVRIITAGLYCIQVYNWKSTPPRRADHFLVRYLPCWDKAFASALDKLADQYPEIVTHFAGYIRGAEVGLLYFWSLEDAEKWLKGTSHALEPLGFSVYNGAAQSFYSSETSFMLYPIPAVSQALGLLLEPAKLVASLFPPSSPIIPKGWAERESPIYYSTFRSWRAPSEGYLLYQLTRACSPIISVPLAQPKGSSPSQVIFVKFRRGVMKAFRLLSSLSLPRGYIGVPVITRDYVGPLNYLGAPASDSESPNPPRLESPLSPPTTVLSWDEVLKPTKPLSSQTSTSPEADVSPAPSTSYASSASVKDEHLQLIAAQLALLYYNVSQLTKSLIALGPLPPHSKK